MWIHIAVVVVSLARCGSHGDAEPAPERLVTLIVASPEPRPRDASNAPSRQQLESEQPGEATAPSVTAGAPGGAADTALGELDPELLEALAEADPSLLEDLDPEALAELDAVPPELVQTLPPNVLETLDAVSAQARAPVDETPMAPPEIAPASPTREDDPRDDGLDPDDAVADAALPEERPEDPPRSDEESPPPEPEEEDETKPEDQAPEPEKAPRWQTYLHADGDSNTEDNSASPWISSVDSVTDELRRTDVVAQEDGPVLRPVDGVPIQAGTPALFQADGEPLDAEGDAPSAGEPVDAAHVQKAGGGLTGEEAGRGAPGPEDGSRGGPLARSGRRAEATRGAVLVAGGPAGNDGVSEAPRGTREISLRSASWWAPAVARVIRPAAVTPPQVAAVTTPHPTEATHAAPEPRPDEAADRGGTDQEVEVDEKAVEAPVPVPDEPEQGEAEEIVEEVDDVEEVESIADLRADMGWGGTARKRSRPTRTMPGVDTTDGNLPTSNKVANAELELDWVSAVDAKGTPAGRYRAEIDEVIEDAWVTMDLSLHERALGIQGFAVIVFHVQENGKVTDKTLLRSSGYASLDSMAMDAVPDRLPRFPKDMDQSSIFHRYTFNYRNPMIVGGQPGQP